MMDSEQAIEVLEAMKPRMTSSPEEVEHMQAINLAQHALDGYNPSAKGNEDTITVSKTKIKEHLSNVFSEDFISSLIENSKV